MWVAVSYFGFVFYVFDRTVRVDQRKKKRGEGMTQGRLVAEVETALVYQRVVREVHAYISYMHALFRVRLKFMLTDNHTMQTHTHR